MTATAHSKRVKCLLLSVITLTDTTPKNNATSIYLIIPYDKCVEFNALIRDKCTDDPFITDRDTFDKIKACCDVIMNNCNTLLTTGCVYAILGILLDSMCFKPCTESVQPQKMTQILLYINENFKKRSDAILSCLKIRL